MGVRPSKSIVTKEDKAVLRIKGVRDIISIYQKKADFCCIHERILVKQLLKDGKLEKAKCLMKKSLATQEHLKATDFYLEQLEKAIYNMDYATMQQKVVDALKLGNSALKVAENILNIDNLDRILLASAEGQQKQMEIEATLRDVEIQGKLEEELEKEILNMLGGPKPARNLYKKTFKLKNINMPKSSTSIPSESQVTPTANKSIVEDLKIGRNRLSSFIKGLTSSIK